MSSIEQKKAYTQKHKQETGKDMEESGWHILSI